jgi:hypothetical protein
MIEKKYYIYFFNNKLKTKFNKEFGILNKLSRRTFVICWNILSILFILLIRVSVLIICINYFNSNSILITSSKNSLFQSS